jgi:hypothetical protein
MISAALRLVRRMVDRFPRVEMTKVDFRRLCTLLIK